MRPRALLPLLLLSALSVASCGPLPLTAAMVLASGWSPIAERPPDVEVAPPEPVLAPVDDAADLVGVYRAPSGALLILDASGAAWVSREGAPLWAGPRSAFTRVGRHVQIAAGPKQPDVETATVLDRDTLELRAQPFRRVPDAPVYVPGSVFDDEMEDL